MSEAPGGSSEAAGGSLGAPGGGGAPEYGRGFRCESEDPEVRRQALDAAFDYRGNVTLLLTTGNDLVGYLSNRDWRAEPPFVEVLPADGSPRRRLQLADVRGVVFSGRDTAEGKSWQTWLQKYEAKKQAEARGEEVGPIDLFPESLD